jgi:hypothetical protein
MLLTEQEFVMTAHHKKKNDPSQEQEQDQDQKQANLQAQAQGQLQGQAQGQAQLAVQSLKSDSDNDNDNDNSNHNNNSNKNYNDVSNDVDNKLDNRVDNDIDNRVENTVDNRVNVDVDIKVDLDLKADGLSSPVIDLSHLHDIDGSIVMPDVVYQTLNGDGNQFNIDQVNNLVDHDYLKDAKVSYDGGGGDFEMNAKAEGGDVDIHSKIGDIAGNAASGVNAHADAVLTQDAFNQTITQGANIQFNSITMNVAGDDLHDSHDLG